MRFLTPDVINGLFEVSGGLLCWANVARLVRDKRVVGVYWEVQGFFSVWGLWNLYYYPALGQWASFAGGLFLSLGNTTWTALAVYYQQLAKARPGLSTPEGKGGAHAMPLVTARKKNWSGER